MGVPCCCELALTLEVQKVSVCCHCLPGLCLSPPVLPQSRVEEVASKALVQDLAARCPAGLSWLRPAGAARLE